MYIFAFGTAFFILKKISKEGMLNTKTYTATEDDLFSFITTGIIFLLIGARVFSALVYDTSGLYRQKRAHFLAVRQQGKIYRTFRDCHITEDL